MHIPYEHGRLFEKWPYLIKLQRTKTESNDLSFLAGYGDQLKSFQYLMSHFITFGFEIIFIMRIGIYFNGDDFNDFKTVTH